MVREDIKIPDVLIVVKWDILEEIADNGFLGIMSPLGMAEIGGLSLLVYVGGVAEVDTGSMGVSQQ